MILGNKESWEDSISKMGTSRLRSFVREMEKTLLENERTRSSRNLTKEECVARIDEILKNGLCVIVFKINSFQ